MNAKNSLVTYLLNFAMSHDIGYDLGPVVKTLHQRHFLKAGASSSTPTGLIKMRSTLSSLMRLVTL